MKLDAFVAVLLVGVWPRLLPAQPTAPSPSFSLNWVRAEGAGACIPPRELALSVEQLLGRRVFVSPAQAQSFLEATVAPAAGAAWRVRIVLTDARGQTKGQRELHGTDKRCEALNDALSLALAVMIDPDALGNAETNRARAPLAPAPVACSDPSPPWHWSVSAGVSAGIGLLPGSVGPGAVLRGLVQPPQFWAVDVAAAWWPTQRARATSGQAVDLTLAYAGLALCPLLTKGSSPLWQARGCFGGQVGAWEASGVDLDLVQQRRRGVASAVAYANFFLPLVSSFGLSAVVGAGMPVVREKFVYVDSEGKNQPLFRLPAVTGWAELGAGVLFLRNRPSVAHSTLCTSRLEFAPA